MKYFAIVLIAAFISLANTASGNQDKVVMAAETLFNITNITHPPLDVFTGPNISGTPRKYTDETIHVPIEIKGVSRNNMMLVVIRSKIGEPATIGWVMPTFVETDKPLPEIVSIICNSKVTGEKLAGTRGYGESC